MWLRILLVVYCLLVIAGSMLGGWLPSLVPLRQRGMQLLMCLVAGLMLGVAILHLIPHSLAYTGSIDVTALWCLGGVLVMWALVRVFHFHQHVEVDDEGHIAAVDCDHGHDHAHEDTHSQEHHHSSNTDRWSWLGVAFGLSLHTLIDGIAMGAAMMADAAHGEGGIPLYGIGVFLAVLLHKPMDALAITALMAATGWSRRAQTMVNAAFATMCPIGAVLVISGASQFGDSGHWLIGCALAFSGGVFLWISLGDLLPDVHVHSGDALKFAMALLAGVAIAYGIGFLEPEHAHDYSPKETHQGHDHGHGHSH